MRSGRIILNPEYTPRVASFPWLINRRIYHDIPAYFQSHRPYRTPITLAGPMEINRPKWGFSVVRPYEHLIQISENASASEK